MKIYNHIAFDAVDISILSFGYDISMGAHYYLSQIEYTLFVLLYTNHYMMSRNAI